MTVFIIIALSLVLLFFLAGYIVFLLVFHRKITIVSKMFEGAEKELMLAFGDKISLSREKFLALPKEDVYITSHDGLKLRAEFIKGNDTSRTIICVHGYRSSALHDFGPVVCRLMDYANILLIDQRSHGKSEGKYITFGALEARDCVAWAEYLMERMGKEHPVYFDGVSMGGTTVSHAASLELPENVKGIISDCGFSSTYSILYNATKNILKVNPAPLLWVTNIFCKMIGKFSIYETDTLKDMEKNRLPILFAHGKRDSIVPYTMSQKAYDACKCEKFIVLSEDAEHGLSYMLNYREYNEAILKLFAAGEKNAKA